MNPENTARLLTTYPLLYRNLRDQTFECNDGWFDLVWQVSTEIELAAQRGGIPKTAKTWPSVGIVKEKFGSLRVQGITCSNVGVNEVIHDLVERVSQQSMVTCELCGSLGERFEERRNVEVLCTDCRKIKIGNS
jgi:hypothetical protein